MSKREIALRRNMEAVSWAITFIEAEMNKSKYGIKSPVQRLIKNEALRLRRKYSRLETKLTVLRENNQVTS